MIPVPERQRRIGSQKIDNFHQQGIELFAVNARPSLLRYGRFFWPARFAHDPDSRCDPARNASKIDHEFIPS
jgi:hypothetical protein